MAAGQPPFRSILRTGYEGRPLPAASTWPFVLSIWAATALAILSTPAALWLDIVLIAIAAVFTVYFLAWRHLPGTGR